MVVKCKPVYNFQSVEFEVEIDPSNEQEIVNMFLIYAKMLAYMKNVAPEQEKAFVPKPKPKKNVKMMSEAQRNWLINLGADEEEIEDFTYEEASNLIKELR